LVVKVIKIYKNQKIMVAKTRREEVNNSYTDNALKMMKKRYLAVDEDGVQETPVDMLERVAKDLAAVEKDYGHDTAFVRI